MLSITEQGRPQGMSGREGPWFWAGTREGWESQLRLKGQARATGVEREASIQSPEGH